MILQGRVEKEREGMAIVELKTAREVVTKAVQPEIKPQTQPNQDYSKFQKMLEAQQQSNAQVVEKMADLNLVNNGSAIQMKSVSAEGLNIDPSKIETKDEIQTTNKLGNMFAEVNRGQLQMENIMEMMGSGRNFSGQELLAIQAGIYSIVQEMELAAKAVEQVNHAHNTLWRTQLS